ncbi:hypothetical protein [Paenibacillus sp. OV219]|uniref:hypothetical protein n=1 Tax=Paenibacillus sp. OV219 TaxID=1884377 RepID=UPI0008D43BE6|nr:hypothetical protein [Paenibacillus sp. OV219]SEP10725.1 hypothetical protein SAMN05518847_11719 [Paenibacillus sp. OV219]
MKQLQWRWVLLILIVACSLAWAISLPKTKEWKGQVSTKVRELSQDSLPEFHVSAGDTVVPVTQGTYCWGNRGCADYAWGKMMTRGLEPTAVEAGKEIHISLEDVPVPLDLIAQQFLDNNTYETVTLADGVFKAPTAPGVYHYGVSAYWKTEDGKYSKGDSSVVFVIEVK